MEVGPGLGSLTLAILETGADLTAVEIDPPLAQRLPQTIAEFMPNATNRFRVVNMDALKVTPSQLPQLADAATFTLVANLPYNVATPILLTLLERFGNLDSFLVMVQKEVAERLSAQPGSKVYGTSFAQRRKTLHAALRKIVPSGAFERAGIDPTRRGETLDIDEFVALATACKELEA